MAVLFREGGVFLEKGKPGPKTDNPKTHRLAIRYDDKCKQVLDDYCKQENVSKMEATRRGIMRLEVDLKNK